MLFRVMVALSCFTWQPSLIGSSWHCVQKRITSKNGGWLQCGWVWTSQKPVTSHSSPIYKPGMPGMHIHCQRFRGFGLFHLTCSDDPDLPYLTCIFGIVWDVLTPPSRKLCVWRGMELWDILSTYINHLEWNLLGSESEKLWWRWVLR